MSSFKYLLGISLLVLIGLTACSRSSNRDTTAYLTIKGSDTMVHLASTWAEVFMSDADAPKLSVTGGGSGTGIAALLNGTTDICIASRNIKSKEVELATNKGIMPVETTVARDGIAVIIHPDNPVNELTIEEIGKIYTGAYTNWNQVGGPDAGIIVLSRESSSGTYVFFQKRVLAKRDYVTSARLMPATSAIVQSVSSDEWSIGYVGLGYAVEAGDKVKTLKVKDTADSPAVAPTVASVSASDYAIARSLYIYTNGEPTGSIKKFIDFTLSAAGQKIVIETGYVPVN
ncbi:MAG: PstS family phosphate ABC transporter substrate-binding protein [Candidatus Marinimicrobia bacterium]|nr:PstS family phosphate ABC transporter substrate-binding protein [Candidatus Neomarinimicrobiota bacterium]